MHKKHSNVELLYVGDPNPNDKINKLNNNIITHETYSSFKKINRTTKTIFAKYKIASAIVEILVVEFFA